MTYTEFEAKVMSMVGPLYTDMRAKALTENQLESQFFKAGWTVESTIRFLMLTEEINPKLDEDVALARMAEISAKYES